MLRCRSILLPSAPLSTRYLRVTMLPFEWEIATALRYPASAPVRLALCVSYVALQPSVGVSTVELKFVLT